MVADRLVYKILYGLAGTESRVHWHHDESPALLAQAIELLGGTGRALDIGCGTGVNSVFMAGHGLRVTAVDFVPRALTFAAELARRRGVEIEFVRADITEFQYEGTFDLVLDSGCFHTFAGEKRMRYKERLLAMTSPSAHYVLVHASNTKKLDFGIGPRSRSRSELETFFGPELKLADFRMDSDEEPSHQHMCEYRFVRG